MKLFKMILTLAIQA